MPVGSESTDYHKMHPPTHLNKPIGLFRLMQAAGHLCILTAEWICVRLFEKIMGKGGQKAPQEEVGMSARARDR
jgi:hypothetical protein